MSSNDIQTLRKNEVFVFGRSPKEVYKRDGIECISEAIRLKCSMSNNKTGHCYSIPTLENMPAFRKNIGKFIKYAKQNQDKIFLVTKIGWNIAGYSLEEVAPMFHPCSKLPNVYLPYEFYKHYKNN